jgi:hypothetical protein
MLRVIWKPSLKPYRSISPKPSSVMENVFIGADYSPREIQIYTDLFKEFCDVFAWSYEEMLGIDPKNIMGLLLIPFQTL